MGIPGDERLQRGYRTLRRVSAGADAPWTGSIVSTSADESGVLVDVALLPDDWRGWDAAPSGHVLAPRDVVRRADGHDVLLPLCTERVADLLERRRARRTALSAGESVTLCVSLVRGLAEAEASLGESSSPMTGTWWLTAEGRPVLATDTGQARARQATVELLTAVATEAPSLASALENAIAATQRGSLVREIDHIEPTLFAAADPEPLATTLLDTTLATRFDPASARTVARDIESAEHSSTPREAWGTGMLRHVDAEWADALSRVTTGVWRALRERRPSAGHRRPLLAAAAIAGVILVGGLMWPVGDEKPATADIDGDATSSATPVAMSETTVPALEQATEAPIERASADTAGELALIAAELLTSRTDCITDTTCLQHVMQSPDTTFPAGVIDLPAAQRAVALVDDLGGLAVLRVDAVEESVSSQLMVIVRRDQKWLLRDVYDVAQ